MKNYADIVPLHRQGDQQGSLHDGPIFHKGVRNVLILQVIAIAILALALIRAASSETEMAGIDSQPVAEADQ